MSHNRRLWKIIKSAYPGETLEDILLNRAQSSEFNLMTGQMIWTLTDGRKIEIPDNSRKASGCPLVGYDVARGRQTI